jgi:ElaB/YqjD/DUF883 family membrane-anchored ribosome-binding protein
MNSSLLIDTPDDRLHAAAHLPERAASRVADRTDQAIRQTQRVANEALEQLSGAVQEARNKTVPTLERLGAQAESLARRGFDAARQGTAQVRERAVRASDQTVGYIREEPVKAVLIAAATGAALMGLIALLSRREPRA